MAKFTRRGKTKVILCLTIASSTHAPTAAELTAGTLLSDKDAANALTAIEGWTSESTFIEIPNFGSSQTPKIAGEQQSPDSSMKFWEDDTSNPLFATLARGTQGFMVFAKGGAIIATSKVDVFPFEVGSNSSEYTAGNEAAAFNVKFAINGVPAQNIAVLA